MTHDEMIDVILAHKEGISVQLRKRGSSAWFPQETRSGLFDFIDYEYRIKPEPKTIWVNEYEHHYAGYFSKKDANDFCADVAKRRAVKYQEVIE